MEFWAALKLQMSKQNEQKERKKFIQSDQPA
jgi:hypothetical protein